MNCYTKQYRTANARYLEIADLILGLVLTLLSLLQGALGQPSMSAKNLLIGGAAILQLVRLFHRLIVRHSEGSSRHPLSKFSRVIGASKCPFAQKAKLTARTIRLVDGLTQQVESLVPVMTKFTSVAQKNKLDGVVIEIEAPTGVLTLPMFCDVFNSLLRTLAARDPLQQNCFAGDVLAPGWQFSFNSMRFFVTTFAPFYDPKHPRFSQSAESAFIYLQPEFSFDQHGIHAGNPQRTSIKEAIRRDFLLGGYSLDVPLIEQPHEALKYVKPLTIGDPAIRWWEANKLPE
jgi:YqcI/YcgG family protein